MFLGQTQHRLTGRSNLSAKIAKERSQKTETCDTVETVASRYSTQKENSMTHDEINTELINTEQMALDRMAGAIKILQTIEHDKATLRTVLLEDVMNEARQAFEASRRRERYTD